MPKEQSSRVTIIESSSHWDEAAFVDLVTKYNSVPVPVWKHVVGRDTTVFFVQYEYGTFEFSCDCVYLSTLGFSCLH